MFIKYVSAVVASSATDTRLKLVIILLFIFFLL